MSNFYQLEFERPLRDLDRQLDEAVSGKSDRLTGQPAKSEPAPEVVTTLRADRDRMLRSIYSDLGPWETVRVARHPDRPQSRDYIERFCRDFSELHGDRRFGDDPAIVTGFGRIGRHKCMVIGHHKGRTTQEKIACHFGCAHPEGYRKALAKMKLAEKFGVPIVTLVDTPGAYPGLGAEQRGQAEAIAVNLREMSRLRVPVVSAVIGEGGSGGALGIAVANRVGMMRFSWYSVISPEGCAAILWKEANEQTNAAAAKALNLTADENLRLGIVDAIIEEPMGAAHRDPGGAANFLESWIVEQLDELTEMSGDELVKHRHDRFRRLGEYSERVSQGPAVA